MEMLGFFENIGLPELLIILFIILLLFGGAKLPQLARSMGASVKEFKKGAAEGVEDEKKDLKKDDSTSTLKKD